MGNTFRIPWTNRRSWISNKRPAAERGALPLRRDASACGLPYGEPLRPCGGGGGGAKRPQSRGLWPRLWFGRPGGRRPPAAKRRRPPGTFRVSQPLGSSVEAMGGTVQPILAPSPWDCRVPFRPTARRRGVCASAGGRGNRCGPAGGRRGRKAPTKPGPLAPALVWQAGAFGPRPPNAAAPPAGRPTANKSLGKRKRPRNRGLCCFY